MSNSKHNFTAFNIYSISEIKMLRTIVINAAIEIKKPALIGIKFIG